MEARQALDELNAIITKMDAFAALKDILAVVAEAEARTQDAARELTSLNLQVDLAEAKLRELDEVMKTKSESFNKDLEKRATQATRDLEARIAALKDEEAQVHSARIAIREDIAIQVNALQAANDDLKALHAQIAAAQSVLDKIRADIKALQTGVGSITA